MANYRGGALRREAGVEAREAALEAREAVTADRMNAARTNLAAAAERHFVADTRDIAAEESDNDPDRAKCGTRQAHTAPLVRAATRTLSPRERDRESHDDRKALTEGSFGHDTDKT